MKVSNVTSAILATIFLCTALTAQVPREDSVVLKNWAAPLYWQPTPTESESSGPRAETRSATPQFDPALSPLVFVAITPCRVVDTRASQMFAAPFGPPSLTPGPARSFPIQLSTVCSIPSIAQAYSLNVTVAPPGSLGFLTIWPSGQAQPNAVTLDDLLGTIVNNAAIVPAGTPNGGISAVVNGNTDLVIDINGYYEPLNNAPQANGNTAFGIGALFLNTTGVANTASGTLSLFNNTTGSHNTASGHDALFSNSIGAYNTASGENALYGNTIGIQNSAFGFEALQGNTNGFGNTAIGYQSLNHNSTGDFNIAIGNLAGSSVTGSYNIDIGNTGAAPEDNVIRIGNDALQRFFFAAGIYGVTTNVQNGIPVLISSNGQFGTTNSSRRFKEDIQDMAGSSSGLLRLRPVTYRYQRPYADGSKPIDYGLIAEEVAEVYPDLVVKGADGQIETVQYQKLTPMLLNELQKEHETVRALQAQVAALQKAVETLVAANAVAPIDR